MSVVENARKAAVAVNASKSGLLDVGQVQKFFGLCNKAYGREGDGHAEAVKVLRRIYDNDAFKTQSTVDTCSVAMFAAYLTGLQELSREAGEACSSAESIGGVAQQPPAPAAMTKVATPAPITEVKKEVAAPVQKKS